MWMVPSVMTAGQKKERRLKARPWRDEPIKVISAQANGEKIVLGEPTLAEDNWLHNLIITIQNTSKKDIVFVEEELHFLRPEGSPESVIAFPIIFGTPPAKVNQNSPNLAPGETWQSSLSENDYLTLQDVLSKSGYATGTLEVEIITTEVLFRDKKQWSAGEERDADQPAAQVKKKEKPLSQFFFITFGRRVEELLFSIQIQVPPLHSSRVEMELLLHLLNVFRVPLSKGEEVSVAALSVT